MNNLARTLANLVPFSFYLRNLRFVLLRKREAPVPKMGIKLRVFPNREGIFNHKTLINNVLHDKRSFGMRCALVNCPHERGQNRLSDVARLHCTLCPG